MSPVRIGMMSLGCPKTLVDSELILGKLGSGQYDLVPSVADCDVALLNTCSFIRDAQEESIDRILELIQLKKENQIRGLIVMGCLVQQFPQELQKEFQEVDAFVGSGEYAKIPEIVEQVTRGAKKVSIGVPGYLSTSAERRVSLTPRHYRYLKISEGCDHICSFCTIPGFRGKHRSRRVQDVLEEAKKLVDEGAKELILTGQDTSYFGRDYANQFLLPDLLRQLNRISGLEWIRVLYAYPSCIPDDLIHAIRDSEKVCHYLDMPLQHASDRMLTAMRRGITKRRTVDLIHRFRELIPDVSIRTTFIVGFPGETEEDFEELLAFMKEMSFDRLGIFKYSRERGSHADSLPGHVSERVKNVRFEQAMKHQQKIAFDNNQQLIGRELRVLVESRDEKNPKLWAGRSYMDAPEVDGTVFVPSTRPLATGRLYPARVVSTEGYDLVAELTADS